MSQTDIIIIISTALFASTFGAYAIIRVVKKHTRPIQNVLVRPNRDIELTDYIEPIQENSLDLLASPEPTYQRILNYENYERVPSFSSGNPPSYHTIDRWYINSYLENNINLDFILWLILFFILVFIIFILIRKLIISNKLIVNIISIILIFFILYYNSKDFLISTTFMTPLSISRISYINDLDVPIFADFESEKIEIFNEFSIKETTDFLKKLEDNESYIVDIGFIPNIAVWDLDAPVMSLSNCILINRDSSPTTITKFILERLEYMVDYFYLDDTIIQKESGCAVSLTYYKLKSI